jgi:hypothetical protein
MIDHRDALNLAATSLDFPLGAVDRAALEGHLGQCSACRAELAEFRRDAARLAALQPIAPPGWVRSTLGRTRRSNPLTLLAAAALLLTAAGLALAVGSRLLTDQIAVVTPTQHPVATAAPVVVQPTSPFLTPRPSLIATGELAWEPVEADGGGSGSVDGGLAFQDAYIVFGADESGLTWVARSTDGERWETNTLGRMVEACEGSAAGPDSAIYAAATDGHAVVLAGLEYAMDVSPCGTQRAVTWISVDGRTWQRSAGFGAVDGFAEVHQVWAIAGGWEAIVGTSTGGPTTIWRSADALQWDQVREIVPGVALNISAFGGAAPDGTRVLSIYNGDTDSTNLEDGLRGGESSLQTSTDGEIWKPMNLTLPLGRRVGIVPPGPTGPAGWMLITGTNGGAPITWTSPDLVQWAQGTFPRDDVASIAVTPYGYIATGETLCGAGGSCSTNPSQYLSTDGLLWTPFTSSVVSFLFVDGPAGVLAFSTTDFRVWRLLP